MLARIALLFTLLFSTCCMGHTLPDVTPPPVVNRVAVSDLKDLNVALVDYDDGIRCSGTWISARNILTAAHCVKGNPTVFYRVRINPDEQSVDAVLDKVDFVKDLAVLIVVRDPPKHLSADIGDEPKVGDPVESVNNSHSQEDSYMHGYVGGFQKTSNDDLGHDPDQVWMQVFIPATFGCSGGSVIDANGDLVGVFSWKYRGWDGVAFMVRVKDIKEFLGAPTGPLPNPDPKEEE